MASCDLVPSALAQLAHADPMIRRLGLRDLCPCHLRRNIPAVWDRVLQLVHDPDLQVRKAVLHLLADGSPRDRRDEAAWAITLLAQDADPQLRRRARGVMAAYRRTGSVNVL